jgi:endonuclease G
MKRSKIPIPVAFYKVILDLTPPYKMLGFIIPNQTSKRRVLSFAVPVDAVENLTGYDFFSNLDDNLENSLEKTADIQAWQKFPDKKL